MALQYGPHPRPHNYNSNDSESEAAPRPTSEQCQKYFNKACAVGDLDAVKRYLSHGASVHGMRGCFTPLYHALSSEFGDKSPSFEVARYLIERGADINKSIYFNQNVPRVGYPPAIDDTVWLLAKLCEAGPMEVVEFLLAHGAEANAAALTYACRAQWRSVELCQLLLDHGAPVDPVEEGGHAPLFYACINFTSTPDHLPLAAFLLDRGADVNREAYLESACAACDVAIARLLLDRGADADHKHHGATPLESTRNRAVHHPGKNWAALVALLEAAPPARVRSRTHWRRRILFHVVGRRAANPGSKRHELGLYRVSTIASFLM